MRSVYLIADGKNLDDVLEKQAIVNEKINALKRAGIVKKSSGIFQLLISDSLQKERIETWNNYFSGQKKSTLLRATVAEGKRLGFHATAFQLLDELLNKNYLPLSPKETDILRNGFADDYIIEKKGQVSLVSLLKVEPENKKIVYDAFSGQPDITVIDKQYMTTKLLGIVTSDFGQIGWMTSVLVFFVLLLTYGRIELALVSFVPMVIAFIWILGIMGIAGIEFNVVNIILSALIFGLGDDYSLFIMDGLLQEYKTGRKNLSSYKSSIVLS